MRCAIVSSGTVHAAAISAVVSPPTARNVSATDEAGVSDGWQHMNSRISESSRCSSAADSAGATARAVTGVWSTASASRRRRACSLRSWSCMRRLATWKSQPPGLDGTPSRGHCVAAATSASCTASSAAAKSPLRRTTAPMTCGARSRSSRSAAGSREIVSTPYTTAAAAVCQGSVLDRRRAHGLSRLSRATGLAISGRPRAVSHTESRQHMELMPVEVRDYLDALVPQRPPEMRDMEAYAREHDFPIIGPAAGNFCYLVARMIGARSIFELGSGYGYSTAWFARAVRENGGGVVHHVVWDEDLSSRARGHLEALGFSDLVRYHVGEAVAALQAQSESFDLIFNDIDKQGYA